MQSFIKINFTLHVNPKHKTPTLNITKQHWMHFDELMFIMEKLLLTETCLDILSNKLAIICGVMTDPKHKSIMQLKEKCISRVGLKDQLVLKQALAYLTYNLDHIDRKYTFKYLKLRNRFRRLLRQMTNRNMASLAPLEISSRLSRLTSTSKPTSSRVQCKKVN